MTHPLTLAAERRIVTEPRDRCPYPSDFIAYDDRMGPECSPIGTGDTEAEAINDLLEQLE